MYVIFCAAREDKEDGFSLTCDQAFVFSGKRESVAARESAVGPPSEKEKKNA